MGAIALLAPREEMVRQAQNVMNEGHYTVDMMRHITTETAVEQALSVIEAGATVIIARGLQASLISRYTNLPVVQIRLTAQELGVLITQAKRIASKERPRIAVVTIDNAICDTSCFNYIFDIDLKVFTYDSLEKYKEVSEQAVAWAPDVLIGGDVAVACAAQAKIPTLFLASSEDSLREAMRTAQTVKYASDLEKRTTAQFDTLLNSSFNGFIQLGADGIAIRANHIMEEILGLPAAKIVGKKLFDLVPGLERASAQEVLENGGAAYSTFLTINRQAVIAILSPVQMEDGVDGAVFSCHRVKKNMAAESQALPDKYLGNNISHRTFDTLHYKSRSMEKCIHNAKLFSQSSRPILIYGEMGTERMMLAQCIHNNSLYRNGPFVTYNCSGLSDEMQINTLFGTGRKLEDDDVDLGAFGLANNGTLFLHEVEKLSIAAQYRIYRAIRYKTVTHKNSERPVNVDVRVIATCSGMLHSLVQQKLFREDLFYLLSGLVLQVPPIRQRREDLADLLMQQFNAFCEMYDRYHVLTSGAKQVLLDYPWYGNRIQMESFCERMVLTAPQRSISESFVKQLLEQMYPDLQTQDSIERIVVYKSPEAVRLAEALERNGGDRGKTAAELGISKTTLWRHMKKHGIAERFESQ